MYVVFGANGRAGGAVIRALIRRGERVRAVVRHSDQTARWKGIDAEVVSADLTNVVEIAAVLENAIAAFVLNPPPVSGDIQQRTIETGCAIRDALRRARTPRVVVLSSIGAQHPAGTGVITTLHRFEELLRDATPAVAMLRSGYFMETWGEGMGELLSQRQLSTFVDPTRRIAMVSTSDVGEVAAQLMLEHWVGARVVELSGPEDYAPVTVATTFAEVLGQQIQLTFVPPQEQRKALAELGAPTAVAAALAEMYDGIAAGLFDHESGAEQRRGSCTLHQALDHMVSAHD